MPPRMIILAAGEGRRLRPLTDDRPKCLLEVAGKPLIDWQMETAWRLGVHEIAVVTGYRPEKFEERVGRWYHNPHYAKTNMVETLWCARAEFQGEMIVSYGDILYEESVLQAVIESEEFISTVIDLEWRRYWELRFSDPLSDAESLRLNAEGRVVEIGQKIGSMEEVQGQYIGLTKFRGPGIKVLEEVYSKMKADGVQKMYMTDLLQTIIDRGYDVHAIPILRKWIEIDSIGDYELANEHVRCGPNGPLIPI